MDKAWYSDSQQWVKGGREEAKQTDRPGVQRWLGVAMLLGLLVLFWCQGLVGLELFLGLVALGTIWGGDKGPGSDEPWPRRRREPDWRKMILKLMRQKKPAPPPEPTWPPPYRMGKLPPIDLEPMPSPLPLPPLERRDREKLIKAMEGEFAKRFREVLRKEALFSEKPIDLGRGIRPTPPTLHFQTLAPQRPEKESFSQMLERFLHEPPPVEESFSQKLLRHLWEPEPREETFSEKLERHLQGLPDFRTEGEKRRDARQAAARRKPPKPQPSPMERLLAQLEAERRRKAAKDKERKSNATSSTKKTADEFWETTTSIAKRWNALRKRIEAGEAAPEEEVFAIAALHDFLAEASPKLKRSRAEAREKVLEILEKGSILEAVPLGEGASFEQDPLKLPSGEFVAEAVGGTPEGYQTYFDLYKTDEFLAEAVVEANRILQAPGNTTSIEEGKLVVRDPNGNVLMEVTGGVSGLFYGIDLSGEKSAHITPQAGGSLRIRFAPPLEELFTTRIGFGRHLSVGVIMGLNEKGKIAYGLEINIGFPVLPIPGVDVSGPADFRTLPREVDLGG